MTQPAELTSLGYIGIRSERLDDWDSCATRLLGMQQVDRGGAVRAFRMDDRKQRLVVAGDGEGLGLLAGTHATRSTLCGAAEANGVEVNSAPRSLDHIGKIVLTVEG